MEWGAIAFSRWGTRAAHYYIIYFLLYNIVGILAIYCCIITPKFSGLKQQ